MVRQLNLVQTRDVSVGRSNKRDWAGDLVFPIRDKILKPGFRVPERKTPGKLGVFGY